MKRRNNDNVTAPIVKKSKSRWDVGPNDIENEGIQPKCESKTNTQKFSGEVSKNLISKFIVWLQYMVSSIGFH